MRSCRLFYTSMTSWPENAVIKRPFVWGGIRLRQRPIMPLWCFFIMLAWINFAQTVGLVAFLVQWELAMPEWLSCKVKRPFWTLGSMQSAWGPRQWLCSIHLGWDKMDDILQTTVCNEFSSTKCLYFKIKMGNVLGESSWQKKSALDQMVYCITADLNKH